MAADSRARRASLLRPDVVGFRAKTSPRLGAFSSRAGRDAGELDEGKTARAAVAGGGLLRPFFWPAFSHPARNHSHRGFALALAFVRLPAKCAGNSLGRFVL